MRAFESAGWPTNVSALPYGEDVVMDLFIFFVFADDPVDGCFNGAGYQPVGVYNNNNRKPSCWWSRNSNSYSRSNVSCSEIGSSRRIRHRPREKVTCDRAAK